jgi:hypothetical protein
VRKISHHFANTAAYSNQAHTLADIKLRQLTEAHQYDDDRSVGHHVRGRVCVLGSVILRLLGVVPPCGRVHREGQAELHQSWGDA